jgi:hypothetical protein
VPPVACPGISFSPHLWQNKHMKKWVWIFLAVALGIGLGLLYGWVINPIEFVDLPPDTLRADFRADYILMVAEAYQVEKDTDLAARRLAIFGSDPPAEIAAPALQFGPGAGFSPSEMSAIEELVQALRAWQPAPGAVSP